MSRDPYRAPPEFVEGMTPEDFAGWSKDFDQWAEDQMQFMRCGGCQTHECNCKRLVYIYGTR